MRRFLVLAMMTSMWFGVNVAQSQTPTGQPNPARVPTELQKLLAEALRTNPDIRVAEAKLRLAEAETMRERLRVLNKIAKAYAEFEAAREGEKEGRIRYVRAIKLWESSALSDEEFGTHKLTYLKLKSASARAELRLQMLIGRPPAPKVAPAPRK